MAAIRFHYDVGEAFYSLWLEPGWPTRAPTSRRRDRAHRARPPRRGAGRQAGTDRAQAAAESGHAAARHRLRLGVADRLRRRALRDVRPSASPSASARPTRPTAVPGRAGVGRLVDDASPRLPRHGGLGRVRCGRLGRHVRARRAGEPADILPGGVRRARAGWPVPRTTASPVPGRGAGRPGCARTATGSSSAMSSRTASWLPSRTPSRSPGGRVRGAGRPVAPAPLRADPGRVGRAPRGELAGRASPRRATRSPGHGACTCRRPGSGSSGASWTSASSSSRSPPTAGRPSSRSDRGGEGCRRLTCIEPGRTRIRARLSVRRRSASATSRTGSSPRPRRRLP